MSVFFENGKHCNPQVLQRAYINDEGHLIFVYGNGYEKDLGQVVGECTTVTLGAQGEDEPTSEMFKDESLGFIYQKKDEDDFVLYIKTSESGLDSTWYVVKTSNDIVGVKLTSKRVVRSAYLSPF